MLCANTQPRNTYRSYCAIECLKRQTCNQINSSCSINEQGQRNESCPQARESEGREGRACPRRRELAPERRPAFVDLNSLPLAGARHPWVGHGYCITSPRHIPECSAMARFRRDAFSAGQQWLDIGLKHSRAIIRGKIFTSCIRKGSSGGNIAPSWQHIAAMHPK